MRKTIEQILVDVARDFPGIRLRFHQLCPQCILECGSQQLDALPEKVLKDDKSNDNDFPVSKEERKSYGCKRGHLTSARQLKEGFSFEQPNNVGVSKVEGNPLVVF